MPRNENIRTSVHKAEFYHSRDRAKHQMIRVKRSTLEQLLNLGICFDNPPEAVRFAVEYTINRFYERKNRLAKTH